MTHITMCICMLGMGDIQPKTQDYFANQKSTLRGAIHGVSWKSRIGRPTDPSHTKPSPVSPPHPR